MMKLKKLLFSIAALLFVTVMSTSCIIIWPDDDYLTVTVANNSSDYIITKIAIAEYVNAYTGGDVLNEYDSFVLQGKTKELTTSYTGSYYVWLKAIKDGNSEADDFVSKNHYSNGKTLSFPVDFNPL